MKFKVTTRNKLNGEVSSNVVEAMNERDARFENDVENFQILSVRPLRQIGEKPEKQVKSTYVSIKRLRARQERDLCNKQMKLGKYSPEAIAQQQAELAKELSEALGE